MSKWIRTYKDRQTDKNRRIKKIAAMSSEQLEEMRAKQKAQSAKWRLANPELSKQISRKSAKKRRLAGKVTELPYLDYGRHWSRFKKYGITKEEWEALFCKQGRVCAICQTNHPGSRLHWSTDHDPETGIVRGILCLLCNLTVHRRATPETLRAAADYLERNNDVWW